MLIVISAVTVFLVGRSRTDARLVEHTLAVQNKLSELHIQIRRADATHPGVLLLAKPYRKADLARMIRVALSEATPASTDAAA